LPPIGDAPIVNMPEEDRATDIGNMHKKFGKDRACGSRDNLTDRQTHRQTYSSYYFATTPAGEVTISTCYRCSGCISTNQTTVNV